MNKKKDTKSDIKVPEAKKAPQQPAYVQFQGGYQSQRGGGSGGGKRPASSGSPIRRSAPGGGK